MKSLIFIMLCLCLVGCADQSRRFTVNVKDQAFVVIIVTAEVSKTGNETATNSPEGVLSIPATSF